MIESQFSASQRRCWQPQYRERNPGWRTPSPPRREVEPLSPNDDDSATYKQATNMNTKSYRKRPHEFIESHGFDGADDGLSRDAESYGRRGHRASQRGPPPIDTQTASRPDLSKLDILATLALSPSQASRDRLSNYHYPSISSTPISSHEFPKPQSFERASKRTRSEVISHKPMLSGDSRPSTSYAYPPPFSPTTPHTTAYDQNGPSRPRSPPSAQANQLTEDDVHERAEILLSMSRGFGGRYTQRKGLQKEPASINAPEHETTNDVRTTEGPQESSVQSAPAAPAVPAVSGTPAASTATTAPAAPVVSATPPAPAAAAAPPAPPASQAPAAPAALAAPASQAPPAPAPPPAAPAPPPAPPAPPAPAVPARLARPALPAMPAIPAMPAASAWPAIPPMPAAPAWLAIPPWPAPPAQGPYSHRPPQHWLPQGKRSQVPSAKASSGGAPPAHPMGPMGPIGPIGNYVRPPMPRRDQRGWPKGKPRGPKPNTGIYRKKGSTKTAKQTDTQASEKGTNRTRSKKGQQISDPEIPVTDWDATFYVPASVKRPRRASAARLERGFPDAEDFDQAPPLRPASAPPKFIASNRAALKEAARRSRVGREEPLDICKSCQRNKYTDGRVQDLWINCNGCKCWFHIQCAGFADEKKVKDVDRFHCHECAVVFGPTTYVRKSSRAHASVDYAGLHEGNVRTAVDVPDHHYIEPIKSGSIEFLPEFFPRMRPELVTRDYLEKCGGWTEPILIPAALNPRPRSSKAANGSLDASAHTASDNVDESSNFVEDVDYDCVRNDGQDSLDMVIPEGLTVRRAAELYGPEEKVDVIDVKLQEGEDRRWSMRQWADYYEADGWKPVRNVISLEVSESMLGKLIRRPKVVRDLDLQDAVWPQEETAKGVFPRVQFYCLMSVADCYTDFHIDFGGSSVYYHILKGRKTFFFIPPKQKHLKKYEDWCNSPDQNSVFLGNETKECYRVDLYAGDTMLIPSGWIHAVWTPESSLVIGGNFLTRMHYGTQININEIEKATNVTRKFRYPYFQKILWLTVVRYLEQDPIPSTVVDLLCEGYRYERKYPIYFENHEDKDDAHQDQPETYNARYYSQSELDGLPDLIRYIYRTVMISLGKLPGVSKTTQDAVVRSMPKNCGDHLEALRTFALWTAWKRGNENIPPWAYPDAPLADVESTVAEKKLSVAAQKRLERQAMKAALLVRTERRTSLRSPSKPPEVTEAVNLESANGPTSPKASKTTDSRRMACDSCRKSKRRCTHNGGVVEEERPTPQVVSTAPSRFGVKMVKQSNVFQRVQVYPTKQESISEPSVPTVQSVPAASPHPMPAFPYQATPQQPVVHFPTAVTTPIVEPQVMSPVKPPAAIPNPNSIPQRTKGRACDACRRSKHRCTHNQNAAANGSTPAAASSAKRVMDSMNGEKNAAKKIKRDSDAGHDDGISSMTSMSASAPTWQGQTETSAASSLQIRTSAPDTYGSLTLNDIPVPNDNGGYTSGPAKVQAGQSAARDAPQITAATQPAVTSTATHNGNHNGNPRTFSNSNSDSRSRTSSAPIPTAGSSEDVPGSHSPPTSPLTEPMPSSPVLPPALDLNTTQTTQPAPATPLPTPQTMKEEPNETAFSANGYTPPSGRRGMSARRPSTASSSGNTNINWKPGTGSRRGSAHASSPLEKIKREVEEEESVRVAKELAAQDAGLRRRGVVRYTR